MFAGQVRTPPIKCQGIKTKLVPFILGNLRWDPHAGGRWIEPFLGSGVVAFNLAPPRALLADTNEDIVRFYRCVQSGTIDRATALAFLRREGELLRRDGERHYYRVRERFNELRAPLDFLFLSRACFNGVMRYNKSGRFNVPFCRKPERFARAYITKICNQIDWVAQQMQGKEWELVAARWPEILSRATASDFIYCDPPYVGRNTGYYNSWDGAEAAGLASAVRRVAGGFAVSMWMENRHRRNAHVAESWDGLRYRSFAHFYHVGPSQTLRSSMDEILIIRPGFETVRAGDAKAPRDNTT
jgi:DNA adenine methylase